jgi:hypothetical protein
MIDWCVQHMSDSELAEVEHELQETVNRLKQAKDAAQKRTLLLHLRLLLMEADKLLDDVSTL